MRPQEKQRTMEAFVVDHATPAHLRAGRVARPEPGKSEALVSVEAFSLNRGECHLLHYFPDGHIPGWDLAGVVVAAAQDGSGPAVGTRVFGFVESGSWAELARVPTGHLAALPAGLDLGVAASLPIVGLSAWHALDRAGLEPGMRVLVTGPSGGFGQLAIQLARLRGGEVEALVARPGHERLLKQLGVRAIHERELPPGRQFDLILESVGGETLGAAIRAVRPGGTVVTLGNTSDEPTTFDSRDLFSEAPGARLLGFLLFADLEPGGESDNLAQLARHVLDGALTVQVSAEYSWPALPDAIDALMSRQVVGKAVIRLARDRGTGLVGAVAGG